MANRIKNTLISFRVTPEVSDTIHTMAESAGLTLSEYLTECATGTEIINLSELTAFTKELKAQGTNLNRLTVLANCGKIQCVNLDRAADLYSRVLREIRKLFERRRF